MNLKSSSIVAIYLLLIVFISGWLFFVKYACFEATVKEIYINEIASNETKKSPVKNDSPKIDSSLIDSLEKSNPELPKQDSLEDESLAQKFKNPKAFAQIRIAKGKKSLNILLLYLVIISGAMGACLHGLTSLGEYVGNGTYNENWALWYFVRPIVGSLLAITTYWFLRSGLIFLPLKEESTGIHVYIGVSGLVGIFSKQALYKISDLADTILASKKEEELKHKLEENPSPIIAKEKIEVNQNLFSTNPILISIEGENFNTNSKVFLNGNQLNSKLISPKEIQIEMDKTIFDKKGTFNLTITNPPPGGGQSKLILEIV